MKQVKVVRNKNGTTRSYIRTQTGKWQKCGQSTYNNRKKR